MLMGMWVGFDHLLKNGSIYATSFQITKKEQKITNMFIRLALTFQFIRFYSFIFFGNIFQEV